jgi:ABC-type branched-subunit amino acid transport system ATPase component/ABC-type branched-subunit amino acid transport system permease subunit
MRAVVDNPELLDLTGTSPVAIRRWAWVIGCTFAALSAMLLALDDNQLSSFTIQRLVAPSFAAAAIGYFTSLPMTFVGGLFVGVLASVLQGSILLPDWLLSLPAGIPFFVLFVALVLAPKSKLRDRLPKVRRDSERRTLDIPMPAQLAAVVVLFGVLAFIPGWVGVKIGIYTATLCYVMLFLSLGLLVRTAGQVSLCHVGLAAIGATTFARLGTDHGWPWLAALGAAALLTALVGAIVAIPAIRLSGVFLALATFGFGLLLEQFFYRTTLMFGAEVNGILTKRPGFASSDRDYYYVVLAMLAIVVALVWTMTRTRFGRLLRGLGDSQTALETHGTSVVATKLLAFTISSFFAGLSGALLVSSFGVASNVQFLANMSLTLLTVLFIVRVRDPWYAFIGATIWYFLPRELDIDGAGFGIQLVFSAVALSIALTSQSVNRTAAASLVYKARHAWPGDEYVSQLQLDALGLGNARVRRARSAEELAARLGAGVEELVPVGANGAHAPAGEDGELGELGEHPPEELVMPRTAAILVPAGVGSNGDVAGAPNGDGAGAPNGDGAGAPNGDGAGAPNSDGAGAPPIGLELREITVRYGGIVAVDGLDVTAPMARITGLIGPNGAGKTTLFNAASGRVRPSGGDVRLRGTRLNRVRPPARARRGLGRSFQQPELFTSMTVRECVALGREAGDAGWNPVSQVLSWPGQGRATRAAVDEALDLVGIRAIADERVAGLSTGQQRLVELARCLASPFDLLLLDEPSAGLDAAETARFGQTLRRVATERGTGILLVEHDMSLVMDVCSYLYVVDFGRLVFEGTPEEVRGSDVVRAVYLGSGASDLVGAPS